MFYRLLSYLFSHVYSFARGYLISAHRPPKSPLTPQNPFETASSDCTGVDEVFLSSCKEVCANRSIGSPVSPVTATLTSISPAAYKFRNFCLDEVEISDGERLSAFYPNAIYDFYGTPSGSRCVYKSGDAWPVSTGPESQRIIREARPVYDHPITATWRAIGERIYKLLDNKKVLWTSIDPLAFAEAGKKTFSPLLLWIGVEPESLLYEDANTAAEAITFLLAEAGFSGIEIGFRESIVTRSVSGPKMLGFDPFHDRIPELRKPFTPTLGLSIAPLNTPHYDGTGALYFRESKESDRIFLLTCAHVARPPPVNRNTGLSRKTKSHPREHVIALGNSGYTNAARNIMATISTQDDSIKTWGGVLRRLGEPREGEPKATTDERNEHLALVEKAKKKIEDANKLHNQITKYWAIPNQRVIGEVVHVEPVAVAVEPHHYTRDWALIWLYSDKFDRATFRGNKVYIGGNISSEDYLRKMFPRPEDRARYMYPQGGLLQAFGVIQAHEIYNPQHLDANEEKCHFVVKNGFATGTTIGRAMGMESFTRVYEDYGIKETSIEIAVLSYDNKSGPFSALGDSGSIVLDRNGRILGMITGGSGVVDSTDISYLTPYWYIQEEIKVFPGCHLYEVVE